MNMIALKCEASEMRIQRSQKQGWMSLETRAVGLKMSMMKSKHKRRRMHSRHLQSVVRDDLALMLQMQLRVIETQWI